MTSGRPEPAARVATPRASEARAEGAGPALRPLADFPGDITRHVTESWRAGAGRGSESAVGVEGAVWPRLQVLWPRGPTWGRRGGGPEPG